MTGSLSPNTQAILLLTAPLLTGRKSGAAELLTPSEYRRLAQQLRSVQRQPADLMGGDAGELLRESARLLEPTRLERLLGRGFQLSQAIERWQSRAIWVISRADAAYPRRLKARLRDAAPPALYGCGDAPLLEVGGLAVVGSRQVSDELLAYTEQVGAQVAETGKAVISGGARGVDQAAVRGAVNAGGLGVAMVADSLEKAAVNRDNRAPIMDGRLVLVSPFDPASNFNVGHAMQRNKLIYALADMSLVVNSDVERGGTWAGAVEQLSKLHFCPVYVRSTGGASAALDALIRLGARHWPNPATGAELEALLASPPAHSVQHSPTDAPMFTYPQGADVREAPLVYEQAVEPVPATPPDPMALETASLAPADHLFSVVRIIMRDYLAVPRKEAEVATALGVSAAQAKTWLQRLVDEGTVEKRKKPVGFVVKERRLFD